MEGLLVCADYVTALTGTIADLPCQYGAVSTHSFGSFSFPIAPHAGEYVVHTSTRHLGPEFIHDGVPFVDGTYDASAATLVRATLGALPNGVEILWRPPE